DRERSFILALVNDLGGRLGRVALELEALRQLAAAGDDLLIEIVRVARKLIGARYAAIHVVNDGRIEGIVQDGLTGAEAAAIGRLPSRVGLFKAVESATGPVRIRDVAAHRSRVGLPAAHPRITSLLAVPMMAGPERYGHLYLGGK